MKDDNTQRLLGGLTNEITMRRIVRGLVEKLELPDGTYDLVSSDIDQGVGDKYRISLEFLLPKDRPIRYGTAVVGGATRLCIYILAVGPTSFMNFVVHNVTESLGKGGEVVYSIFADLMGDQDDLKGAVA